MPTRLALLLALTLIASPAAAQSADSTRRDTLPAPARADSSREVREYRGAYSSGYEISWFEPCGFRWRDGPWWVTLTEKARLQRDSLLALFPDRPREGLAVRWRATVGPKMAAGAGHMGRGTRYMLVTEIISLRPLGPGREGACGGSAM